MRNYQYQRLRYLAQDAGIYDPLNYEIIVQIHCEVLSSNGIEGLRKELIEVYGEGIYEEYIGEIKEIVYEGKHF